MQVNMINYGFDNFKATTASSRRDIVIADAAAAEVLVSISNAINGVRTRGYLCGAKHAAEAKSLSSPRHIAT